MKLDLTSANETTRRYYDLLGSDFAPSGTELHSASIFHENLIKQIVDLDTIDGQQGDSQTLELRALDAALQITKALLSPMRRLPPEIMAEIFIWCTEDRFSAKIEFGGFIKELEISPFKAPLLLMRVCRRWRRIALNTSRLFTNISLWDDTLINPLLVIRMWLQQSGTLPISIDI
ncbi:hypothetical protein M422DRAFT_152038, partial [Sphaerobolus stellatus SS14]